MAFSLKPSFVLLFLVLSHVAAMVVDPALLDACPGYAAQNIQADDAAGTLTADLVLAGDACNVFGDDVAQLKLEVQYETDTRLHLKISDPALARYEVPDSVFPRPTNASISASASAIAFSYTESPFTFTVSRASTNETLFTTAGHPLIFEPQYLRVKTTLPPSANVYGLGEHTDTFRLPTQNYTRTFWSRDAYGVPNATNLYGNHPIYYEHRTSGTHGVFLLSSDGMDVKIDDGSLTNSTGANTTLEYNVVGGILDFYFLAGDEKDPVEVTRQYADLVGLPAEVPYWGLGLHQCRFGYQNFVDVSEVITNYSAAGIPLETMWTDIDYMEKRRTFTNDPDYFPTPKLREIVDYLHGHDQQYILMVDPAVAYLPNSSYAPYDRGTELDVWLKRPNGTYLQGVVWPGVTVYPDWFHPDAQSYWSNEFSLLFNPDTGIDIDGAWIDMNEPSSFCVFPCTDPFAQAIEQGLPPNRTSAPPDPNTPIFGNTNTSTLAKRGEHDGQDLDTPPYMIENAAGQMSSKTADTDGVHYNGLIEYDTHNIFGTMMSNATRQAMLDRRPGKRTLIITRSTFAGAGARVGKWLGDNFSTWWHYRASIAGQLGMASVYQIPMVGSDICGFAENTTETLCARWAMLGAFSPFMRNHNADTSISQEFYRWPTVAAAAKNALDIRYRLMDYLYTALHQASVDGTPVLNPLFYKYPQDANTFAIDLQFLFGDAILVSPVTEENATAVSVYLPADRFYAWETLAPVDGNGSFVELSGVNATSIPLHIRGGTVLPLRTASAMTTKALRAQDVEFVVAPGLDGTAEGRLYMDDGESIVQEGTTELELRYANGTLSVGGTWGFASGVNAARVRVLGQEKAPEKVVVGVATGSGENNFTYVEETKVVDVPMVLDFVQNFTVQLF